MERFDVRDGGFGASLAVGLLGQIGGGYLGDLFDKRVIAALCMLGHGVAMVVIAYAQSLPMVVAFALLHGIAWGVRGPLMVGLRADYFGPGSFGTIMGFSSLIVMLGMSGGPIFAGYMADLYGSYQVGFLFIAGSALLGALCFLLARPPHPLSPAGRLAARYGSSW